MIRLEQLRDTGITNFKSFPPASPGLETPLFFHSFTGLMNGCERNLEGWRSSSSSVGKESQLSITGAEI